MHTPSQQILSKVKRKGTIRLLCLLNINLRCLLPKGHICALTMSSPSQTATVDKNIIAYTREKKGNIIVTL